MHFLPEGQRSVASFRGDLARDPLRSHVLYRLCLREIEGITPMSQTIQISDKSAALLAQQAAAHGKSLEAWVEELAVEKAQCNSTTRHTKTRAAAEGILELQKHVKPDPEG